MQASPQRQHRSPGYPTRLEINADPALLREHLPATWSTRPELAAAAAVLLTLVFPGCQTPSTTPRKEPTTSVTTPGATNSETATRVAATATAVVAPLFNHGQGSGSFGCIVVAPPAYLSEDEAWQVIDEELAKRGINLTERDHTIQGIEIPLYDAAKLEEIKEGDPLPEPLSVAPVRIDRADPRRRIMVEFVSVDKPPEKTTTWRLGSIGGIELKLEADVLRELVATKATEPLFFGALYDPACSPDLERPSITALPDNPTPADWENHWKQLNAPAKAESKRLLRLQVQDFIKWLQAQGAI